MNNYSFIQQILHRTVLSSKLIREIMFDFEKSLFSDDEESFDDKHVFVAGLARSGSTILLNTIYQSNQFASLTYEDMPFILAPNLWSKISFNKSHSNQKERMHGDGLSISTKSPEAFEEVYWKTFGDDLINRKKFFLKFIALILKKNKKLRYLSKNNQNIRRISLISEIFPNSIILIPFRDPRQQALSLLNQHIKFSKKQNKDTFTRNYMKWIGHSEFGLDYKKIHSSNIKYLNELELNHWLEQWYLTYKTILELSEKYTEIYFIEYESLCGNPNVWSNIKKLLNINPDLKHCFKENKKAINQVYDDEILDKCDEVFGSLSFKSFGK